MSTSNSCVIGLNCGESCINKNYSCKSKLGDSIDTKETANFATTISKVIVSDSLQKTEKTIGEGWSGVVGITKKGTAYKRFKTENDDLFDNDDKKNEVQAFKALSDAGLGPKLLGISMTKIGRVIGYEMEYLRDHIKANDTTDLRRMAWEGKSDKILRQFAKMHAVGWSHGDIQFGNVLLKGDDVKIIDTGLATKINSPKGYTAFARDLSLLMPTPDSNVKTQTNTIWRAVIADYAKRTKEAGGDRTLLEKIYNEYKSEVNELIEAGE